MIDLLDSQEIVDQANALVPRFNGEPWKIGDHIPGWEMKPGPRTHKQSSLRVVVPEGLPAEFHRSVRELVSVQSSDRGKGHARALLHKVCAEADRFCIVLMLRVEPFAEGMDADMLERFYGRHGFVRIQADPALMARQPVRLY